MGLKWDFLQVFQKNAKKKIRLPDITQENGSCNENTQFKIINRRILQWCYQRSKLQELQTLTAQRMVSKLTLYIFMTRFLYNDLLYKTTSLPPLNCETYIEPTVSSLCLLTPAAFRIQIRTPKSIFTMCMLEPFTTFIYQPKRLLNKSVTVNV